MNNASVAWNHHNSCFLGQRSIGSSFLNNGFRPSPQQRVNKFITGPGLPVSVDRRIGEICVPKGTTKRARVTVDAVEVEQGLIETLTGIRDEQGTASGQLTLDCCCATPQETEFDLNFTSGGKGGGAISVKIAARRKS